MDMNKIKFVATFSYTIFSFILVMMILLAINNNQPADPELVDPTGIRFEQVTPPEFLPVAPVAAHSATLK
jgi:hypothetical protein